MAILVWQPPKPDQKQSLQEAKMYGNPLKLKNKL